VLISSVVTCGEILGTNELVKQFNEITKEKWNSWSEYY
jgi:hypothetical protein